MVYQFVSLPYTYPRFEIKLPPSGFFRKRINSISMESIPPGFVGPAQTIGGGGPIFMLNLCYDYGHVRLLISILLNLCSLNSFMEAKFAIILRTFYVFDKTIVETVNLQCLHKKPACVFIFTFQGCVNIMVFLRGVKRSN